MKLKMVGKNVFQLIASDLNNTHGSYCTAVRSSLMIMQTEKEVYFSHKFNISCTNQLPHLVWKKTSSSTNPKLSWTFVTVPVNTLCLGEGLGVAGGTGGTEATVAAVWKAAGFSARGVG